MHALQKPAGCFNCRVVTLLAYIQAGETLTILWYGEDELHKPAPEASSSYNHNTLITLRTSVEESHVSQTHFKVELYALMQAGHRCSEGCQCDVVVR